MHLTEGFVVENEGFGKQWAGREAEEGKEGGKGIDTPSVSVNYHLVGANLNVMRE